MLHEWSSSCLFFEVLNNFVPTTPLLRWSNAIGPINMLHIGPSIEKPVMFANYALSYALNINL